MRDINWRDNECIRKYLLKYNDNRPIDLKNKTQPELCEILFDEFKPTQLKSFGSYVCASVGSSHHHANLKKHLDEMENVGDGSKPKIIDHVISLLTDVTNIESESLWVRGNYTSLIEAFAPSYS